METKMDQEGSSMINPQVENEELFFAQLVGEPEHVRVQLICAMDPSEVYRYYDYLVEKQELLEAGVIDVEDPEEYSNLLYASLISLEGYPRMDEHKREREMEKQKEDEEIAELLRTLDEKQWNKRHPLLKKNKTIRNIARKILK